MLQLVEENVRDEGSKILKLAQIHAGKTDFGDARSISINPIRAFWGGLYDPKYFVAVIPLRRHLRTCSRGLRRGRAASCDTPPSEKVARGSTARLSAPAPAPELPLAAFLCHVPVEMDLWCAWT